MKVSVKYFPVLLLIIYFVSVNQSFSQWSIDSTVNTQVCDVANSQVTPKISLTNDGGCYVTWFDNRAGGYSVYLQRLNSLGVKQFSADGLLISSNTQSSSLVDWDMITDDSNNAVIVFTDTRNGNQINPFAYRISPSGSFLWGNNGVQLSDSFGTYQANPRVAKTTDGNFVISWIWSTTPNKVALQKISPTGAKLWGANPMFLVGSTGENFTYPSLVTSDNGAVIIMWSGYSGTFLNPQNYRLYTSKLSPAGAPMWSNPQDTVYNLFRVAGFFVPKLIADGQNGALYVWQDDRNSISRTSSFVQHLTSTGTKLFPPNGSECSNNTNNHHFDAWACYVPSTQETFSFWKESNGLQSQFGVYGQKFSSNGTRQWADIGKEFKALSGNSFINQLCYSKDTNVMAFFNEGTGGVNNVIKGFRVDRSGNFVWTNQIQGLSTGASSKSKIAGIINQQGMSVITWSDGRNDAGGIYAQNINLNGTLGNIVGIKNINSKVPERLVLYQNYPNPFNPSTKIMFSVPQSISKEETAVSLKIFDILGREVTTLVNQQFQAGTYEVTWDASGYSAGLYFIRINMGYQTDIKKIVLAK